MGNISSNLKKTGLYILAAIGVIAIIWIVVQISLPIFHYPQKAKALRSVSQLDEYKTAEFAMDNLTADKKPSAHAPQMQIPARKIIRNGSLSVLVQKVEDAVQKIQSLAESLGGFVEDSQIYEAAGDTKAGEIIIRVPSNRFDSAIADIKKLALKIENESTKTQDVTQQFVDFEAQLRNLRAEEAQYLGIMKTAKTVEDTLKVAQRLSDVRGRIEQIQAQLKYLSRLIDMSSIKVALRAEADVQVFGISWKPLFVIKQSFQNLLSGLSGYADAIIGFVFYAPVLILWLATIIFIAILAWRAFKWFRARFLSSDKN